MPGSVDSGEERFARALEDGISGPDPDGRLRRELTIARLLTDAGARFGPDDAARERMRARILAGMSVPEPRAGRAGGALAGGDFGGGDALGDGQEGGENSGGASVTLLTPAGQEQRRGRVLGLRGRLLVSAAAALCLLVALSGMSLVLARDALPGDALYGVKRSAESAELGLTFGDEPRGFKHLQFATARVDEIEALAARAAGSGSAADAGPYLTALQAFDTDASAGSRLLIETATGGAGAQLPTLRAWAEQQRMRLGVTTLPQRAATRAGGSSALLDRIIERSSALQARLGCQEITSGARDDIGLLPASGPCAPAARPGGPGPAPGGTGAPAPTQHPSRSGIVIQEPGGQPTAPLGPLDPGVTGVPGIPPGGGSAPTTSGSAFTVPLPLPLPEVSLPPQPPLPGLKVG